VRGRLGVRAALVRTRYISLIRALLRQQGYRLPSGSAEGFLHRVRALPLPGRLLAQIAPLLAVMQPLNRQLPYSDEAIEPVAAQDARVQRLRTVPSIGPVTAAVVVATLDEAQRFRHAHQVEAYRGLVPREFSSGDSQRRGPITKAGPGRARWLLIPAAISILRRRPPEAEARRTWALRIAARRGKHVAVVALTRRLTGILYALCREGTGYEPRPARRPDPVAALPASGTGPYGEHPGLSQVRRGVSARVAWADVPGPLRRGRPHPRIPSCAGERSRPRPLTSANTRLTEPRETGRHCMTQQ
jgi:transposase